MGKMMTIQLSQEDANRILLALELAEEKVLGPELTTITWSQRRTECIAISRIADQIFDAGLDAGFGQKVVVKEYGTTKVTRKPKMFSDDVTHSGDGHAIG